MKDRKSQEIIKEWYDNDKMLGLFRHYLQSDRSDVGAVIANEEMLLSAINAVKEGNFAEFKEHSFPLNVNVLNREFATAEMPANHWVAIRIIKGVNNQIIINYIDPTGQDPSESLIKNFTRIWPEYTIARRFDVGHKIQYLKKNDYDCGPFVIYALNALCNEVILPDISNANQSIILGQILRQHIDAKEDFDYVNLSEQLALVSEEPVTRAVQSTPAIPDSKALIVTKKGSDLAKDKAPVHSSLYAKPYIKTSKEGFEDKDAEEMCINAREHQTMISDYELHRSVPDFSLKKVLLLMHYYIRYDIKEALGTVSR